MIRVSYQPAHGERIEVEIPDGRECEVMERAHLRVFPGDYDPQAEAEAQARYSAVMRRRNPAPEQP